jgi:hypothetical protein
MHVFLFELFFFAYQGPTPDEELKLCRAESTRLYGANLGVQNPQRNAIEAQEADLNAKVCELLLYYSAPTICFSLFQFDRLCDITKPAFYPVEPITNF